MSNTKIKEIKLIRQTVISTVVGIAPKLPDTVTACFSDDTFRKVNAIWDVINPSAYSKAESFTVKGVVCGTTIVPKASITVIEETSPIFSFSIISDTHSDSNVVSEGNKKVKGALIDLNEVNPNAKALCIVGDMTDFGTDAEYDTFLQLLNSVPHSTPYFVMGNHDVRWQDGGYKEAYDRFIEKTKMPSGYYDKWIEGFHFIFMSSDDDLKDEAYISDNQLDWLSMKLSQDASADKPIFVFLHQSLANTSAGSHPEHGYSTSGYPDGVVQDFQLRSILAQYPQCLFITGHTHAVVESPKTVFDADGLICVNTASVSYTIATDGYGLDKGSQGLCFDVYKNRVIIKGRDFGKQEWIPTGQWNISFPIKNNK